MRSISDPCKSDRTVARWRLREKSRKQKNRGWNPFRSGVGAATRYICKTHRKNRTRSRHVALSPSRSLSLFSLSFSPVMSDYVCRNAASHLSTAFVKSFNSIRSFGTEYINKSPRTTLRKREHRRESHYCTRYRCPARNATCSRSSNYSLLERLSLSLPLVVHRLSRRCFS